MNISPKRGRYASSQSQPDAPPSGAVRGGANFFGDMPDDLMRDAFSLLDLAAMSKLAPLNMRLRSLVRQNQKKISPPGKDISRSLTSYPNAEYVKITGPLTAEHVGGITEPNDKILHLDLERSVGVDDKTLAALLEKCSKLSSLNLAGCNQLDVIIQVLAHNCPNLTLLSLAGCRQINDEANAPELGFLDLAFFPLPDTTVRRLKNNLQELAALNLDECHNLTDAAIIAFANNCPNLTSLDLGNCHRLTNAAIIAVADNCQNLTSLNLGECTALTNAAIIRLANNCPNLTSLNLTNCRQLNDAAITELANKCPNLTSLDLTDCYQFTDAAITALRTPRPALRVLR